MPRRPGPAWCARSSCPRPPPTRSAARSGGARAHGDVPGGLGLGVDPERRERLVLGVLLDGAVEDVVARVVHQREAVLAGQPGGNCRQ